MTVLPTSFANRKEPAMGLYNVQQINGVIATVNLTDDEAELQGLTRAHRLDVQDEQPAAAKPARGRARVKAAAKPRNKAAAAPVVEATDISFDEILAANDTTVAAIEVSNDEHTGSDAATS